MGSVTPVDEEYFLEDEAPLVSQTDLEGIITYANRRFREVSGYGYEELVGKPHSIVRHPDMPRATFAKMWETIQSGQTYNGTIKNMRKDGKHYWIELEILPIKSESGELKGYISVARPASRQDIGEMEDLYTKMRLAERG